VLVCVCVCVRACGSICLRVCVCLRVSVCVCCGGLFTWVLCATHAMLGDLCCVAGGHVLRRELHAHQEHPRGTAGERAGAFVCLDVFVCGCVRVCVGVRACVRVCVCSFLSRWLII
jgi:hypothetical protein